MHQIVYDFGVTSPICGYFQDFLAFFDTFVVECNPDLVTSYLVTNPDLVTILQKTIFLVHKNISFSDNLVFSAPSIQ